VCAATMPAAHTPKPLVFEILYSLLTLHFIESELFLIVFFAKQSKILFILLPIPPIL
jgi:hypothetical protein